jgi:hypothetical protein
VLADPEQQHKGEDAAAFEAEEDEEARKPKKKEPTLPPK